MKRILVDSLDYGARIGIVEDGVLMELIYERKNSMPIIGNVYIGKIVNVLPGMQAAFVDIGRVKKRFPLLRRPKRRKRKYNKAESGRRRYSSG